jgi:hypothetical protein
MNEYKEDDALEICFIKGLALVSSHGLFLIINI